MSETYGGIALWSQLGPHFEELTELLTSTRSGPPRPEVVVGYAARTVPAAEHSGLTLIRGSGRPRTVAATDDLVHQVDAVQYETGEGPCLEAIAVSDTTRVDDLADDDQWPRFGARCVAETGVRSMFSVRLFLSGDERAALNFYAGRPGAFDDLAVGVGAMFAPYAALAVQNALREREIGHLNTALESSRQIGTAVGILMARQLLTSEEAFARLVTASQHLNQKLREVAAQVELTGALPPLPVTRRSRV